MSRPDTGSPEQNLTGCHVLLTGATGFLGSRLVGLLQSEGAVVTALIRPGTKQARPANVRGVEVDLSGNFSSELHQVGRVDAIIHLAQAGGWREFPKHAADIAAVSISAATRLAEYGVKHGARKFILASSGGIYGPSDLVLDEGAPIRPAHELGFYLQAKASAEALLQCFESRLVVLRLRYFFIYGPEQSEDFLIARIKKAILQGRSISLAESAGPRINPIYVDDAAQATLSALKLNESRAINVAGPETASLREIAEQIARASNRSLSFQVVDSKPEHYVGAIEQMTQLIGPPTTGLIGGIFRTCHLGKVE